MFYVKPNWTTYLLAHLLKTAPTPVLYFSGEIATSMTYAGSWASTSMPPGSLYWSGNRVDGEEIPSSPTCKNRTPMNV